MAQSRSDLSCGVVEIFQVVDCVAELKRLYKGMTEGWRYSIAILSGRAVENKTLKHGVGDAHSFWIPEFVELIRKNNLGTVIRSDPVPNNRYKYNAMNYAGTGNLIAVWVWNINHAGLHEWYHKQPASSPAPFTFSLG